MRERCVALLGRRDEPTDAVEEYCHYLGAALEAEGISLEFEHVPWCELGWRKALAEMDRRVGHWNKDLDLLHYNPLGWARPRLPPRLLGLPSFFPESARPLRLRFSDRPALLRNRLSPPCS